MPELHGEEMTIAALRGDPVGNIGVIINGHLGEIAQHFKPGAKLTLLVRAPSHPDGSRDALQTNEANLNDVIRAIEIMRDQHGGSRR